VSPARAGRPGRRRAWAGCLDLHEEVGAASVQVAGGPTLRVEGIDGDHVVGDVQGVQEGLQHWSWNDRVFHGEPHAAGGITRR
jgi:hypothetical protein